MKKVLVLFWGKAGSVERVANKVYASFNPGYCDIFDVASFDVEAVDKYDLLIFGGSTIGAENWFDATGDNEWNRFFRMLEGKSLASKYIAFFGLGNQVLYPDHFVDALGIFQEKALKMKATIIGQWSTEGYEFTDSDGMADDQFFGLAIDEDSQPERTDERVKKWTNGLKKEAGL